MPNMSGVAVRTNKLRIIKTVDFSSFRVKTKGNLCRERKEMKLLETAVKGCLGRESERGKEPRDSLEEG